MSVSRARCIAMLALLSCALGACSDKSDKSADEPAESSPSSSQQGDQKNDKPTSGATPAADDDTDVSIIKARTKNGDETSIAVKAPKGWTVLRAPTGPDPHDGKFTLREATAGLPKKGTLAAHIETGVGSIYCDLFEQEKPITVANFVGLARGKRKYWDSNDLAWVAKPYYDGTTFHRVMAGFMIQGGDRTGAGAGNTGYTIPDEIPAGEKHDRPGLLCMANKHAGFNEAEFFITVSPAPHIDGRFTIFGECTPLNVVQRIAHAPQSGKPEFKPTTPVVVKKVEIHRIVGGAAKWLPAGNAVKKPGAIPVGRAVEINADGTPKR